MTQSKPTRAFHLPSLRGGRGPSQGRDLFLELTLELLGKTSVLGAALRESPSEILQGESRLEW